MRRPAPERPTQGAPRAPHRRALSALERWHTTAPRPQTQGAEGPRPAPRARARLSWLRPAWLVCGALVSAQLTSCASAAPPREPAAAPEAEGSGESDGMDYQAEPAGELPSSASDREAPGSPLGSPRFATPAAPVTLLEWEAWLDEELTRLSETERRQGSLDCTSACRALEGLSRAQQRICELAGEQDREGRCARATQRVKRAEERVRAVCQCPVR